MKKLTTDADMIRVLEENITTLRQDLVRKISYRFRGGVKLWSGFTWTYALMILYVWFQNGTSAQNQSDLQSKVYFRPKPPIDHIHFDIAKFNRRRKGFKFSTRFLVIQHIEWIKRKRKHFFKIQFESKTEYFGWISPSFISCNLIGYFKHAFRSDFVSLYHSICWERASL